jgi:hypothetical protein
MMTGFHLTDQSTTPWNFLFLFNAPCFARPRRGFCGRKSYVFASRPHCGRPRSGGVVSQVDYPSKLFSHAATLPSIEFSSIAKMIFNPLQRALFFLSIPFPLYSVNSVYGMNFAEINLKQ